jgi:hypothetical protein
MGHPEEKCYSTMNKVSGIIGVRTLRMNNAHKKAGPPAAWIAAGCPDQTGH